MTAKLTFASLWRRLVPLYDEGEAKAVVRMLLEDVFGLTWTEICCDGADRLSVTDVTILADKMRQLSEGEPIQYVLGQAMFDGHVFSVDQSVLIPRPETEVLVGEVSRWIEARGRDRRTTVLDIGTGSGCIAISLKLRHAKAEVTAWDISEAALDTAADNASELTADVTFEQCDILHAPKDRDRWTIIVSNPPYVCEREKADMERRVLDYEPSTALFVPDDDPLRYYKAIVAYAEPAVRKEGLLAFEVNTAYAGGVEQLMKDGGFVQTKIITDQFGRPRVVTGIKP